MKHLKILAFALAVVGSLTAFLGTAGASATVLCKNAATSGCKSDLVAGDKLEMSLVETMTLTSPSTATTFITCAGSVGKWTVESTGGAGGAVKLDAGSPADTTWMGCSATMDTLNAGTAEILHIAGTDNGTVTHEESQITLSIFGSCVYGTGAGTDLGVLEGGATPRLTIHVIIQRQNFCLGPVEVEWNAAYHVKSPTPLYVAAS